MDSIFVTGIGTDVGKTLLAAILTEALEADYWKPIQTGNQQEQDTDTVKSLISNSISNFHPSAYSFSAPLSPHIAAEMEGKEIDLNNILPPVSTNLLIIEGAGGLMVPLNAKELMIDLISNLEAPVVLVSKNYLGSINHTLLSIELLKQRNISILGIVFNGEELPGTEDYITKYTHVKVLGRISEEGILDREVLSKYSKKFKTTFYILHLFLKAQVHF